MLREWQDKPESGKQVFAKDTSDKEPLTKIYKELLTYKNPRKAWLKTGQTPASDTSLKKR